MKFPSRKTAGKVYLLAAVLSAAGLFYWAFFLSLDSPFQTGVLRVSDQYSDIGGGLVHGVASVSSPSDRLSLAAVAAYITDRGEGGFFHRFLEGLPLIFVSILIFCLGSALISSKAGWAALVLFLLSMADASGNFLFKITTLWIGPMPVYSVLVVLVACFLVLEARESSLRSRLLLAAAIGISLLCRSPLALFPPVLAFCAYWKTPKRRRRAEAPSLLVLLLVPYLFAAPTVIMNWSLHGTFIPFEQYSADNNIVTAAAGMVSSSSWDWAAVVDNAPDREQGDSVTGWAVREIARHPVRYVTGFVRRIARVLFFLPLYFCLSIFALWRFRRRPEFQALGMLVGYYMGLHCLMAISDIYFMPLVPLLAALSAAAFFVPEHKSSVVRYVPFVATGVLGLAGVLYLYSAWAAVSYGWAAARREPNSLRAMREAVAAAPKNVWLRAASGRKNLEWGRIEKAIEDYSAALSGGRDNADWRLDLAWAHMRNGRPEALRDYAPGSSRADYFGDGFEFLLIKADLGRFFTESHSSREYLLKAWGRWAYRVNVIQDPVTERGWRVLQKLPGASAAQFSQYVRRTLGYLLTSEMHYALMDELIAMSEDKDGLLIEAADFAFENGNLKYASGYLARLDAGGLGGYEARRARKIAGRIQGRLAFLKKEKIPPKMISTPRLLPTTGAGWLEAAQTSELSGDSRLAREALARAQSLGLSGSQWREAAQLYARWTDHSGAAKAYGRILKKGSGRDSDRLDRAWHLLKIKDFAAAKASLETMDPGKASRDGMLRSVRLYVEMGALKEAQDRLAVVRRRFPSDSDFLTLSATVAWRGGERERTMRFLGKALELSPPPQTLKRVALLYQDMKEYKRAIETLAPLTRRGEVAAEALKITGICQFLNGSPKKAIASLKSSIRRDPALMSAYVSLASVYTAEGRLEEARKVRADAGARRSAGRPGMGAGPQ